MARNYLTIKEAAEMIGVTALTLRNWDKNGKFPAVRHPENNHRVYHIPEIEKFLDKTGKRKQGKYRFKLADE